jgi:hypothetical protein
MVLVARADAAPKAAPKSAKFPLELGHFRPVSIDGWSCHGPPAYSIQHGLA